MVLVPHALADPFTVTTTNPIGAGSLSDAIAQANGNGNGPFVVDTIVFALGPGATINVGSTPLTTISDAVSIDGAGQVTIDGSGAGANAVGLNIVDPATTSVVQGLTIQNFDGKAIQAGASAVHVQSNTLKDNGRGVEVSGGSATISGNQITDNVDGVFFPSPASGGNSVTTNTITGNSDAGIVVLVTDSHIFGNTIEGNGYGINMGGGAARTSIGGFSDFNSSNENEIAFNSIGGIVTGVAPFIYANSIHDNGGSGIAIFAGPTAEPVITDVSVDNSGTRTVTGTGPNGADIRVFGNTSCDPSGIGEGETFLDRVTVSGGTWTADVPSSDVGTGVTATASVFTGGFTATSNFSNCFAVPGGGGGGSPTNGKIAFDSGSPRQISTIDPDGNNLTQLTSGTASNQRPRWSPDGSKITFYSDRDGNLEIYVMNADGSGQTRLTNDPAGDYSPSFSADGSRILFSRAGTIMSMPATGGTPTQLFAFDTNGIGLAGDPVESPDGTTVALSGENNGNIWLYTYANGSVAQVTSYLLANTTYAPAWASDGSKIYFRHTSGGAHIQTVQPDGNALTELGLGLDPAPSPDGTKVAFNGNNGSGKMEIANPDLTSSSVVPNSPDSVFDVDWGTAPVGGGGGGSGSLSGTAPHTFAWPGGDPERVDLTTAGTTDWAIWGTQYSGYLASLGPDVRKSGGGSSISNLTGIGSASLGNIGQFGNLNPFRFRWSNGTTTNSGNAFVGAGISHGAPVIQGFLFSVPADTTPTRLKVWVSAHGGTGTLTAHLSDDSAPDYVDSSVTGGFNAPAAYTIDFNAASAGQTLSVTWRMNSVSGDGNSGTANAGVYAVALGPVTNTMVVDSTGDQGDTNVGNGACETLSQGCTLRAAIQELNAPSSAGGAISFAIPGSGTQTIAVASALPTIVKPVTIDGTTQASFEGVNAPPAGTKAIVLNKTAGSPGNGLTLGAGSDGSDIFGLAIQNFGLYGIQIHSDDVVVAGNYIGTSANGLASAANAAGGIFVDGQRAHIGGTAVADSNVIVGGSSNAIEVNGDDLDPVSGTVIDGNYIGVDRTGNATLPSGDAIDAFSVKNTTIGGATLAAENVIAGLEGITVDGIGDGFPSGNVIRFNSIGVGAGGGQLTALGALGIALTRSDGAEIRDNVVGNIGATEDGIAVNFGLFGGASNDVVIADNWLGTNRNGAGIHAIGGSGIAIYGSDLSGPHQGVEVTGNHVAHTGWHGVLFTIGESGIVDHNTVTGSGGDGILLDQTLDFVVADNTVTGNGRNGVTVETPPGGDGDASDQNVITENSIDGNTGLGIDLNAAFDDGPTIPTDGVTPNDPGDDDSGPNGLQNFPVIDSATLDNTELDVEYSLDSVPGDYTVEFFASPAGHDEGLTFLDSQTITVGGTPASKTFSYSGPGVQPGAVITATATSGIADEGGDTRTNTSEFSAPVSVETLPASGTVSIEPIADTYVNAADASSSHGGEGTFLVSPAPTGSCGATGPSFGLLRFSLSKIPADAVIQSAHLELSVAGGFADDGDPSHYAIRLNNDTWPESVTWNARPADGIVNGANPLVEPTINGVSLSSSTDVLGVAGAYNFNCDGPGGGPAVRSFDAPQNRPTNFTSAVHQKLQGNKSLSLEIWSQACGTATTVACQSGGTKGYVLRYYSREAAASLRPHLVVTYGASVQSVAISATTPTVEAAGKVPLGNVPPTAFLTHGTTATRAAPLNEVPINEIQLRNSPVNEIPINEVGLTDPAVVARLGDVLLSTVPLLQPGGWQTFLAGIPSLANRPVQNVTLRDLLQLNPRPASVAGLTMADLDLSHSPLGDISAVAYTLASVTLAELGADQTWCDALSGPPVNCTSASQIGGRTLLDLGVQGAPINEVPVNEVPVNEVPINEIPVNEVPINEISVRNTPINEVPINEVLLRNSPVDIPINEIPVNEVPINEVDVKNLPINEVPVNEIPVNEIPVNEVPVNEVPINEIPINEVPVNEVPINEIPINEIVLSPSFASIPINEIALPASLFTCGITCTGTLGSLVADGFLLPDKTLLDLRNAFGGGDLPDSFTLGSLQGGYGDTTTGDLIEALNNIPVGDRPSLGQIVLLVQHYAGTAPPKPTFGDLFDLLVKIDQSSSSVNLTLTDVAHLLYGSDATLADLLSAVLSSKDLGWEKLDLAGLGIAQFAATQHTAGFAVDVQLGGSGSGIPVQFSVTLPPGFTYKAGSTLRGGNTSPDPVVAGQTLTWSFTGSAPTTEHFTFQAFPGVDLGPTSTTVKAKIAGGSDVDGDSPAAVTVQQTALEPSSLNNPQTISPDDFVLSYIGDSTDGDVYSLPAPPIGSRVTIRLSHLSADYDLVVYGPGGQVLVPQVTGTPPLDGSAVDDPGVEPTHDIDALPAQTLDDVPVDPTRTVVGISANRGTQEDAVTFISQGGATPYVIQISGFNGVSSNEPYMVRAEVLPPRAPAACTPRFVGNTSTAATAEQPVAAPANVNTVFVVNRQQLARIYGATLADATITALKNRLNTFKNAGFPSSILQVDAVAGVRATYDGATGWNACPSDPARANAVAKAVGDRVRAFKASKPTVQYVVIVGNDDVIPFARLDDRTTLSNEDSFAGSVPPETPIGGALAASKMLSDDPYGTLAPIPFFDRQLYVPEMAVSRLVETPAQMQAQINAYTTSQITGTRALTTGYDFLSDGATQVSTSLGRVATTSNATLIAPPNWSATSLASALTTNAGQPPNLVSINAHADDSRFQAADNSLFASDALASSLTFTGRIVFSMGCHAGLNVSSFFLPPTRRPDWAETFANRGAAAYLGNTGFGYGDSDIVAYSEDLNARFAASLADGLTAGAAFVQAKTGFQADLGLVGVYDEKAMAELTLYGLPMVSITGAHPLSAAQQSSFTVLSAGVEQVGSAAAGASVLAATANDPVVGLDFESFAVSDPTLSTDANRRKHSADGRGDYFQGRDGTLVTHLRPIEPKATQTIATPNAHGALITGLTSASDVSPFDPLFARPTVDSRATEPEIKYDDVAFPAKLQTVTSVKGLAAARTQKLVLAQGQFFSTDPVDGSETGFQRLFTQISGNVYISPNADYAAPTFKRIDALKTGGIVTFTAEVDPGPGDTVKRVLVLFLGGTSGSWTPVELQNVAGNLWTGSAQTSFATVQYFDQAVDSHGNVAVSTNKGFYFAGEAAAGTTGSVTIGLSGSQAANTAYRGPVTVTASPTGDVTVTSLTVDGSPFTSGNQVTGQGVHTVIATGSEGQPSTTTFVIDSIGPTVDITSGPAEGGAASSPVTFTFTASEPGSTFECRFDASPYASCSSPNTSGALGSGPHVFRVKATDAAGNIGAEKARNFSIGSVPPNRTKIVFTRMGDIYSINTDGTGLTQLSSGPPDDQQPVLSPNGSQIVFSRNPAGGRQLFRMDANGTNVVQLTTGPGDYNAPVFSPDGSKVAFESNRAGSKGRDIWIAAYSPTATSLTGFTNLTNFKGDDKSPTWSTTGQIAFTSNRGAPNWEIYRMAATGGVVVQLTFDKKKDADPSFSPDGTKIAFASDRSGPGSGKQEIWIMQASNGADVLRLTTIDQGDRAPFWLDPIRIVFSSKNLQGLVTVPPTGGTPSKIPNTTKDDKNPG